MALIIGIIPCECEDCRYYRKHYQNHPKLIELGRKFQAQILLLSPRKIVVPSFDEWVGVNLLERDDQLKRS